MKLTHILASGSTSSLEAQDAVFGVKPNADLLSQAIYVYLSNQRQGTSKVKTRSEINRTKKKWFKQKGTGNARHGARTPNIFVGGGVSHGPTGMENWTKFMSKQQKRRAMVCALSTQRENMVVLDGVNDLSGKTQEAVKLLSTASKSGARILVVLHETVVPVIRALQNIDRVVVTRADRMNVYETMLAEKIIMTKEAVKALESRFSTQAKAEGVKKTVVKAKEEKPVVAKPVVKKAAAPVKKTVKVEKAVKTVKKAAPVKKTVAKAKTKKATK